MTSKTYPYDDSVPLYGELIFLRMRLDKEAGSNVETDLRLLHTLTV